VLAQRFGNGGAASGLEAIGLATGILDREGLRIIDAEPAGALLAGLRIGELEREGRDTGGGDADIEAGTFAIINLDPLGDSLFALRSVRLIAIDSSSSNSGRV